MSAREVISIQNTKNLRRKLKELIDTLSDDEIKKFVIYWHKKAAKHFEKIPRQYQMKIEAALEKLPDGDVKLLHGKKLNVHSSLVAPACDRWNLSS